MRPWPIIRAGTIVNATWNVAPAAIADLTADPGRLRLASRKPLRPAGRLPQMQMQRQKLLKLLKQMSLKKFAEVRL
jgi:hypothetical protein